MSNTALASTERSPVTLIAKTNPLTASEVKAQVNLIQEVLAATMKPEVHYGKIPGTDKPTLFKAGAEKILTTFRIASMPEVEDLSNSDEIRYRVTVKGVHQPTDTVVGSGVGECSTGEDKYKWRGVVCDEEWEATAEDRRRERWNKGWNGKPAYSVRQVRTNPSDLANTVLKMAKKRAMIDMTLTATAASDVFAQDLEDISPELMEAHKQKQKSFNDKPRTASGNRNKPATEPQCKMMRAKLNAAGKTEDWLCSELNISQLEDMNMAQVNEAVKLITS